MPSTSFCRVFGDGRAQVDTASLTDSNMHGEAEKTEKQKARAAIEWPKKDEWVHGYTTQAGQVAARKDG